MIYKTIAVILQGKEDTQRVLDCAIPLAQIWGAHIVGIHAEPIPVAYSAAVGFPDVAVIETATQAAEERTKEIEAMFAGRMKAAGQAMTGTARAASPATADMPARRSPAPPTWWSPLSTTPVGYPMRRPASRACSTKRGVLFWWSRIPAR